MLILIVHLVNFGQSLSKSDIVQSMLNFEMFLANSDQRQNGQYGLNHSVNIEFL